MARAFGGGPVTAAMTAYVIGARPRPDDPGAGGPAGPLGRCQDRDMAKAWMIDELAHAGPEHLDAAFAIVTGDFEGSVYGAYTCIKT